MFLLKRLPLLQQHRIQVQSLENLYSQPTCLLHLFGSQATHLMESFKTTYTGVSAWISSTIKASERTKNVKTLCGRQRGLPDLTSPDPTLRSAAQRQAINSLVQGSAADILRKALISISGSVRQDQGYLVMQVT